MEQSSPGTGDESAPVTPSSATSTPYIFISECYSGKPPPGVLSRAAEQEILRMSQQPWRAEKPVKLTREDLSHDEFYDMPRKLHPPELELGQQQRSATPPLQSPGGDSVFSEEEWPHAPSVNWNTFPRDSSTSEVEIRNPRPSDSSDGPPATDLGAWSVARRFSKVCISDNKGTDKKTRKQSVEEDKLNPPPRPPKPSYFADAPSHNYLNIASVLSQSSNIYDNQKTVSPSPSKLEHRDSGVATMSDRCHSPGSIAPTADDMYDFPRSHQQMGEESRGPRHCYSNAAPGQANGTVFRYDFTVENPGQIEADPSLEPSTPKSETGSHSSALYSNLPSPLRLPGTPVVAPPCVNRELKPGRKLSDSTSNEPSPNPSHPGQQLGPSAPSVDRALKPFPFRKVPDSPKSEFGE